MQNEATINTWLQAANSPQEVKDLFAAFQATTGQPFQLVDYFREHWLVELICDLFGLLLFGPAFLAAHCALLRPMHPLSYGVDFSEPTHPPYAVRHKMLVRVMQLAGWGAPITTTAHGPFHNAEQEFLKYLLDDPYDPWAQIFTDAQLQQAITAVQTYFNAQGIGYGRSDARTLVALIDRLDHGVPPVIADVDSNGHTLLERIDIAQTLYAGWLCWLGRSHLLNSAARDFLVTNRLCDHALLQQQAINLVVLAAGDLEWQSWAVAP
jgi:hypothetical protein